MESIARRWAFQTTPGLTAQEHGVLIQADQSQLDNGNEFKLTWCVTVRSPSDFLYLSAFFCNGPRASKAALAPVSFLFTTDTITQDVLWP